MEKIKIISDKYNELLIDIDRLQNMLTKCDPNQRQQLAHELSNKNNLIRILNLELETLIDIIND